MAQRITQTNKSFDFLKQSPGFLNTILDSVSNCVLLLDRDMQVQAFNDVLKTVFSNYPNEHYMYKRCGEALGCAYTVEEEKDCGTTSKCRYCKLRETALLAYVNKEEVYKDELERDFYTVNGMKVKKNLEFSVRNFKFQEEDYILLVVSDLTKLKAQQAKIEEQNFIIEEFNIQKIKEK